MFCDLGQLQLAARVFGARGSTSLLIYKRYYDGVVPRRCATEKAIADGMVPVCVTPL